MTYIRVTSERIDPGKLYDLVSDPAHGGLAAFFGAVRDNNHGEDVTRIDYDAHVPLCESTLKAIAEEVLLKLGPKLKVAIYHRIGSLVVGEISVGITVSCPHRAEAFEACRYIIEEIKHRAPIWKREIFRDGSGEWTQGCSLCSAEEKYQPARS